MNRRAFLLGTAATVAVGPTIAQPKYWRLLEGGVPVYGLSPMMEARLDLLTLDEYMKRILQLYAIPKEYLK